MSLSTLSTTHRKELLLELFIKAAAPTIKQQMLKHIQEFCQGGHEARPDYYREMVERMSVRAASHLHLEVEEVFRAMNDLYVNSPRYRSLQLSDFLHFFGTRTQPFPFSYLMFNQEWLHLLEEELVRIG